MHPGPLSQERASHANWLPSAWPLGAVIVVLLVLNSLIADGGIWAFRQIRPSGRFLFFFSLGWQGVKWPLLAFWLTWGLGSFVWRLVLTVVAIAMMSAVHQLWPPYEEEIGFHLVWYVAFSNTVVLGLHALMLPMRDCTSWGLVGRSHEELVSKPLQWSIRQLLIWTTFLAIPLAMAQLASRMLESAELSPKFWLALVLEAAIGALATGAIGIALLSERLAWWLRLTTIAAMPPILFGLRVGYAMIFTYPERVSDSLWWTSGLSVAALTNMLLLRWCGMRWKRAPITTAKWTAIASALIPVDSTNAC
jgi:hypothetical protein